MGLLFLIVIAALEAAVLLVGYRLPNPYNWKLYGGFAYLALSVGLCVYVFSGGLERRQGEEITDEACAAAEELIRSGRQAELAEALKKTDWHRQYGKNFPDTAALFRQEVKNLEAGK